MSKLNSMLLLGLLVVFPLFFIGGPAYDAMRSVKAFWNFGHILFFAVATYLALCLVPALARRSLVFQAALILTVCLAVSALIEWLQYRLSREADFFDILNNGIGALIAVVWCSQSTRTISRPLLLGARFILAAILLLQSLPLLSALYDEWQANSEFPLLAGFESRAELSRWSGSAAFSRSDEAQVAGLYSLKVALNTDRYSGLSLDHLPPDWRAYDRLTLALNSVDPEPLKVTVRVHDKTHGKRGHRYNDRFNRSFLLRRGWNTLSIELADIAAAPASRDMDMSAVAGLGIFVVAEQTAKTIFVDDIRLV